MTPIALNSPLASGPAVPASTGRRRSIEPAVLGVLVFISTELMFFVGLLSAYNIARARVPMSVWPPPDQPRLAIEATAANSVVLVISGLLMWLAVRAMRAQKNPLPLAVGGVVLGALFVAIQGWEWVSLLAQGVNMQRSTFSSFFYLIVGAHGLHVVGGLLGITSVMRGLMNKSATLAQLRAAQIFWTFVVGIWPVIYVMVYL